MDYTTLSKLLQEGDFSAIYKVLTSQKKETDISELKKQWGVKEHKVCDKTERKDRTVVYEDPDAPVDQPKTFQRLEPVARIPIPFQKAIVGKAVSFLFGNPVTVSAQTKTDKETEALQAITRILDDNKADSKNRQIARQLFRSTEVAEIWYPLEGDSHETYGFKTKFRLRMAMFSPWDGSHLFPYFDEFGDMIAFSREYTVTNDEAKQERHFECYTADVIRRWKQIQGADWELYYNKVNIVGKIPVVYAYQEQAEWEDVQYAIERLETLLSNHADTNDYNGSPTVIAEGGILSLGKKGEQGKVLEIEKGGKVEYLSWDHAPESVKMEIDNLFRIIYSFTQTPDISFDSVKGISSISGIALKLLFMDAHLKVMDKREIFDPYLSRRVNLIKAFLSKFSVGDAAIYNNLQVDTLIKPYLITDEKERLDMLVTASGGKALISQRSAVGLTGLVADQDAEYEQLQKEFEAANTMVIGEPTV